MPKSTYLALKVVDHNHGGFSWSPPGTTYIGLFTVAPGVGGGGTEVSGGSYARVAVTNNSTNWPTGNPKSNGVAITFTTPTAGWGVVVAMGEFDASSGGNLLNFANLTISKTINNGDPVSFPIGSFVLTEA